MPRKFRFFAQAFFDPGGGALSPLHEKLPSQGESVAHRLHPRRHGRACPACGAEAPSARRRPGHPRLWTHQKGKTWMPGTRPGMTRASGTRPAKLGPRRNRSP